MDQIQNRQRVESVDFLRGLVMIIMALDHVRSYFHFDTFLFNATDLNRTTPALFGTRFITHLCAPVFIFLAGTSVWFIAQRKSLNETSFFLATRGVWLVCLQVSLIQFGWNFDPAFHFVSSSIISTIGFCMLLLSLLIHLRFEILFVIGAAVVLGHNALDHVYFDRGSVMDVIWSFLHVKKSYAWHDQRVFEFNYPIIPWVGVMALGYCVGRFFDQKYSGEQRRKIFSILGVTSLLVFVLLRLMNSYGDPTVWTSQYELSKTVMSFLDLEKYPPSLLFLCITLGVAFLLLSFLEGRKLERWRPVMVFGKTALFYYVVHIYLIHVLAMAAVVLEGFSWKSMIFIGRHNEIPQELKGHFGFGLGCVYLIWVSVVILLYPMCQMWNAFKSKHKAKWWVSYV